MSSSTARSATAPCGPGTTTSFAVGYYSNGDLDFDAGAVPYWTTFDRYFSATMAETYPNRFYQHGAQTDRVHNSFDVATMPTIWDRLAGQVSRAYHDVDTPFLALWGVKYLDIARTWPKSLADCRSGDLPSVSFVDPKFQDEDSGTPPTTTRTPTSARDSRS